MAYFNDWRIAAEVYAANGLEHAQAGQSQIGAGREWAR